MKLYLLGNLPFFKIHVNHFVTWDNSPGVKVISKCMLWVRGLVLFSSVLGHFLSLIKQTASSFMTSDYRLAGGHTFCPLLMSVRSFLYLFYTSIKLYHTKALSDQAPDWILLWRSIILASFVVQQQSFNSPKFGEHTTFPYNGKLYVVSNI